MLFVQKFPIVVFSISYNYVKSNIKIMKNHKKQFVFVLFYSILVVSDAIYIVELYIYFKSSIHFFP